ncbi:hypothetical protein EON67_08890 [archaeon]|nr:MAG: hypothetical protein EON67_08890 [archaeon]
MLFSCGGIPPPLLHVPPPLHAAARPQSLCAPLLVRASCVVHVAEQPVYDPNTSLRSAVGEACPRVAALLQEAPIIARHVTDTAPHSSARSAAARARTGAHTPRH